MARRHGRHGRLNQSKRATQCHLSHASHAKRPWMCNCASHVKSRWMSPSATPATQKWRGVTGVTAAPKPVQARHPVPSVPRRPRKTTVDVRLCHACHVKSRWMSPSATPATQKWRGVTGVTAAPKPVQARHPVPSVPRLPRKTTGHAKRR